MLSIGGQILQHAIGGYDIKEYGKNHIYSICWEIAVVIFICLLLISHVDCSHDGSLLFKILAVGIVVAIYAGFIYIKYRTEKKSLSKLSNQQ